MIFEFPLGPQATAKPLSLSATSASSDVASIPGRCILHHLDLFPGLNTSLYSNYSLKEHDQQIGKSALGVDLDYSFNDILVIDVPASNEVPLRIVDGALGLDEIISIEKVVFYLKLTHRVDLQKYREAGQLDLVSCPFLIDLVQQWR